MSERMTPPDSLRAAELDAGIGGRTLSTPPHRPNDTAQLAAKPRRYPRGASATGDLPGAAREPLSPSAARAPHVRLAVAPSRCPGCRPVKGRMVVERGPS